MTKSKFRTIWFVSAGCVLILAGCGLYSFSGSTLPPHIKTVAIPLFENQTPEFGVDQKITDALIDAVTRDNTLKIDSQRNADAAIKGIITRITDQAGQYTSQEQAEDFKITIAVKVIFEDIEKRKVLWEETWSQWGRYDNSDILRENGISEAVDKLVSDILNKMVSGW